MRKLIILLFVFCSVLCLAQERDLIDISGHADCEDAITLTMLEVYGPTTAPKGFGDVLEIKENKLGDRYYFEKEHNTVWYRFKAKNDCNLAFDIVPENINDDYDFMLFKVESDEYFFCNYGVKNKMVKPIRTNISRNNKNMRSMTGLEESAVNEFENSGVGVSYSKSLNIKTGELYYLLVDNVYEKGDGHTIILYNKETYKFSGIVKDQTSGKALKAEVILEDFETGKVVARAETNAQTGEYTLKVKKDSIDESKNYNLSIFAEKYFFDDKLIGGKEITLPPPQGFVSKLKRMVKGKHFTIHNINFHGNRATVLPKSKPYLKRLFRLMNKNKSLVILIEGHTNGVSNPNEGTHLPLSKARAETVYNYLINKGINKERLSIIGYGCTRMLYPNGKSESEQSVNRRVEIKIIDI